MLLDIEISALSNDGRGIGFYGANEASRGKTVFVRGALPGQVATCCIIADKKTFLEADATRIKSSPQTFMTVCCPHQTVCGGCPLQPMPYAEQLHWKERIFLDTFERTGKYAKNSLIGLWQGIQPSPRIWGYRNKVEFAFGTNAQGRHFAGFRKRYSHEVIPVNACPVIDESTLNIKRDLEQLVNSRIGLQDFWKFFILRKGLIHPSPDPAWWAIVITRPSTEEEQTYVSSIGNKLLALHPELAGFIHEENRTKNLSMYGNRRRACIGSPGHDAEVMGMALAGRSFELDAGSFFQINNDSAEKLVKIAGQALPASGGGLLDLYCGAGVPGLLYADRFEHYLGIEIDKKAISYARKNASSNKCKFIAGETGKILRKQGGKWDACLLDPPRSGMDEKTLKALLDIAPDTLVYISCNPATMARDALLLKEKYILERLEGVDMFPHTSHLECCGLWKRKVKMNHN